MARQHHRRQHHSIMELQRLDSFVQCVQKYIDQVLDYVIINENDIVVSNLNFNRSISQQVFCFILSVGEGMVEPTALHRVKCQELGCAYQMLAISDLR